MQTDDDILRQTERVSMQDKRVAEYMENYGVSRRLARRAIERLDAKEARRIVRRYAGL